MAEEIIKLKIGAIKQETGDAKSFFLDVPPDLDFSFKAGQFITVIPNIDGVDHRRAYSICTSPYEEKIGFTCKKVAGGMVSTYLTETVKVGDELAFLKPMGTFVTGFHANYKRHLLLVGGGSGITPLFSIIKTALKVEPNTYVSLIYVNRNDQTTIYKEELEALKQAHLGKFNIAWVKTKPEAEYQGPTGRLTPDMLQDLMHQLRPVESVHKEEIFMCGPTGMMETTMATLKDQDFDMDRVHIESFTQALEQILGSGESSSEAASSGPKQITVVFEGEDYELSVPEGTVILDAAEGAGIDLPFSCRGGVCTACMGTVVQGKVRHKESQQALTDAEIGNGLCLTCSCFPESDDVVIEID